MSTSLNKTCSVCGQVKLLEEFSKKHSQCKPCRAQKVASQRQQQKQANLIQEEPEPEIETVETQQIPEIQQDSYVYLLTSPEMEAVQRYKIGKHTGTKEKLVSRYKTYLVDVIVLRFAKLPGNVDIHEKALHELLATYRYKNSEWFIVDQQKILDVFDEYVSKSKAVLWQNTIKEISTCNHLMQVTCDLLKQVFIENASELSIDVLQKISNNMSTIDFLKERSQNALNLANLNGESNTT